MSDKELDMGKVSAKAAAPSSPEMVIFVSNDENHSIELEAPQLTMRGGMPVRIEGSRIQWTERILNVPRNATLELKGSGKQINIVDFLRAYHRCGIDYREAIDLESVSGKKTSYIDKMYAMSFDQVKAEAVRAGVRVVDGDSREKIILEILRNKKEG